MRIKRILFVAAVVAAVLGLTILLLFQSGVDEKVVNSLLPRVEKRLGVQITYADIDASLTSLTLNKVVVRYPSRNCVLASIDRLGIGFRVGPLFFGDVDLTGIRLDGLEARYGRAVSGCDAAAWKSIVKKIKQHSDSKKDKTSHVGRPEVYVASGKLLYNDTRFAAVLDKISGRSDDAGKSAFEVESYSLTNPGALFVKGGPAEIRYSPTDGRVTVDLSGTAVHAQDLKEKGLPLIRDAEAAVFDWMNEKDGTAAAVQTPSGESSAPSETENRESSFLSGIDISIFVKNAQGVIRNSKNPAARWTVTDIAMDLLLTGDESLTARATGRLPGTDARFNFNLKKSRNKSPEIFFKVPDMSLSSLGDALFPSPHVDWSNASLDGEIHLILEEGIQIVNIEGQTVLSNLAVNHERIALEPISDLSFNSDFKMRYNRKEGILNLERFLVSRDLFRFTIRGDVRFDRLAFDLNLNVPFTACKHIAQGIVDALKPRLKNTIFEGNLAADIHLAVDENAPENVVLETNLDNQCRIADFGDIPEPNYFRGPFAYVAYTENEEMLRLVTGPGTDRWTPYRDISPFLIEAVLTAEDGKFWSHTGITIPEIRRAVELNLKSKTMSHGASTITMQLAKNLFLGRERTIARKLQEIVFVWYLESYFSKEELLELYFNIVELGPSIYGISDAAMHYFGRAPSDLNALESVFLIKLLPNPVKRHKTYEHGAVSEKQLAQLHRVLKTMHERKRLTDAELSEASAGQIVFHKEGEPLPEPRVIPYHLLKGQSTSDETILDSTEEEDSQPF